jgi:hypothetical protein
MLARWQYTRQIFDNEDIIIGEASKQNNKQQNFGYTWTHLFSAKTVGEFRYGLGLRTTLVGLKAGNNTPKLQFLGSPIASSQIGGNAALPISRWQTDHQFVYNLSTLFGGNHFFKAGTDIRRQRSMMLPKTPHMVLTSSSLCATVLTTDPPTNAFLNGCTTTFRKGYGPVSSKTGSGRPTFMRRTTGNYSPIWH